MVRVCIGSLSTTRTKTQVYVGCLNQDGMVGIPLEKLQRGQVEILVLSPYLCIVK